MRPQAGRRGARRAWDGGCVNIERSSALRQSTPSHVALQMADLVPVLLHTMRAPRLGTARAAIQTFSDVFQSAATSPALSAAACAAVADDSTPSSSGLLALMQKATGEAEA